MGSMTISGIDDRLESDLRIRAAAHGRSIQDEAREILRAAVSSEPLGLADRIRARVAAVGGVDLELPPREPAREPPAFD